MKKRFLSLLLVISTILPMCCFDVSAASLSFSSISDQGVYDADDLTVYWNGLSSASYYRFAVRDVSSSENGPLVVSVEDSDKHTDWYYDLSGELEYGSKYKIWLMACSSSGDDLGQKTIYIYTSPEVETLSATEIDTESFVMNGELVSQYNCYVGFQYGTSSSSLKTTKLSYMETGGSEFELLYSGLEPDTKYYYRAIAYDPKGKIIQGSLKTVYTEELPNNIMTPSITTVGSSNVTDDGAKLEGKITNAGGSSSVEYGFYVGHASVNYWDKYKVGTASGTKTFTYTIDSLSPDTTYDYYAYAKNEAGTTKGAIKQFTTGGGDELAVEQDSGSIKIGYADGDSQNHVTKNLILPTTGAFLDSKITWSSSNTSVISNSGIVTRPSEASSDATVTLTATVTKGTASVKRTFTFTVLKKVAAPTISSATVTPTTGYINETKYNFTVKTNTATEDLLLVAYDGWEISSSNLNDLKSSTSGTTKTWTFWLQMNDVNSTYVNVYALNAVGDKSELKRIEFTVQSTDSILSIHSATVKNPTIQVNNNLDFTVVTSADADNIAIKLENGDYLYANAYSPTTSISSNKKTWNFSIKIGTPSPQRTFTLYASQSGVLSSNYKVINAVIAGSAGIQGQISYTPAAPKTGETITFTVYANEYTDKISLDVGGTERATSTSYTDVGYLREFKISYAFQTPGTKAVNFYAWQDGTKITDSLTTQNVYVAENNNIIENVTINTPYNGYSLVKGNSLNLSWSNNGSVVPDTYSIYLGDTYIGNSNTTTFTIDSSYFSTVGDYSIGIYAAKEGYTPSTGSYVTINVISTTITTTFDTTPITMTKGDTFTFSGTVSSTKLLNNVVVTALNTSDNSVETIASNPFIYNRTFDLSKLTPFVIGENYLKNAGNYVIRISAQEIGGTSIEIASKPITVSTSNALVTKVEASTYDTYTGVDIKFTATASNTKKVIFEVDGYNIGTASGTGTFTLNYTGFNTPGTRTVWAYPCDSNGDAVRTNGKSVTIEVDSYGTIGQAKIAYPTSATQVNTYEDLTIKWTGANSNCKYNVTVYDPNDDKIASLTETAETELTIDGDDITTVGTYTISIYSVCDYYSPSYASATFYVTAENAIIEGFDNTPATRKIGDTIELEGIVKVDKGYIETITINVWGPNSTSVGGKHKSVMPSGNVKTYDISNIADIIVGQEPIDKIGKYWINVYVRTKGDNEAALVGTKEVTVVSESSISLNAPVITSSLDTVKDADYTLTWTDVDNANLYEIKIPDLGFKASVEKNIEYVKIPKKYLNSTGTYDIEIRAINTKDSSYQDGITSKELVVKETADIMRIIRIEYPETNTVPEGTNLKVKVITDDGRARLSRIGVRHVNNNLPYTWISNLHAKAYIGNDIENALEWDIEIPVNLLENNRTLTLVLYDFLLIEKDTHDITFNCVENHNTMGAMSFTSWYAEWHDETDRPIWWNAPQGLSSAVDYYLADLTHNGETKRIYQNGKDKISGSEPSLTIPADMLSDLGEYTLTITAYKEGYKKQFVSASFTVKCSHYDKYVKEDNSLIKYSAKKIVSDTQHQITVTHNGKCGKCFEIIEVKKEYITENHFGKGTKYGDDGCKCCSCGWDDLGNYKAWFGYVQNGKDYDVYDVAGKRIGSVFDTDVVLVSGKYNNTYLVTYNTINGSTKSGFVPVEAIKDSEWVPSDKIKINGKLISIDKDISTNKIYAPIEDIIKCLNSGVSMNIHNNKNISVYIENNMYGCSYDIFADLSSCSNGEGRTLKVEQSADKNDIHYIWAYIKNDKLYIDVVKFLVDFGGYRFDNTSSEYRRGYAVDVDNDLLRIAESLMTSSETDYWNWRIHDDGLDWMQYAYDVFKFDFVGGAMDAFDERKVQPDKKLKEVIMASITEKALDDSYANTAATVSGIIEILSTYVDADVEIMTAYAQVFNSDNADVLNSYLEPLSDNLELFGLYCSVNEIISLGADRASSLILLTMQYDESIRILDDMIRITPSNKMRTLYVSLRNDVYNNSLSSINKAIAGELTFELFGYAVDNLDKLNKNIKSFKDFMMSSASKLNIIHTAAGLICGNLLKGNSLYDSVAQVQICETNRQFLIADAKAAYNAYSNRPDESNKNLLKTSLYALAIVTIEELEHIIDWQNSYLFGKSAYLLEDIEDEKNRIINLKEQLS